MKTFNPGGRVQTWVDAAPRRLAELQASAAFLRLACSQNADWKVALLFH